MSAHAKALALIESVRNALAAGTEHYDVRGKRLTTIKEVIEALNNDGQVELCPPQALEPNQIITTKPRPTLLEVYKRARTRLAKRKIIDV